MDSDSTLELLWGLRAPSTRGPKAAFEVADVAEAAVVIADELGVDAVSMEAVAKKLGYTKMSLYRYVKSKAELLAVMIELGVGEPPDLSRVRGGWRGGARRWTELMWQAWDQHPWLPAVTVGERAVGPNEVGWSVAALSVFTGIGLTRAESVDAVSLLSGHLRNTYAPSAAGSQPWNSQVRADPLLADVMSRAGVAYPALDEIVKGRPVSTNRRAFGLERILDGIEVLLDQR
ncbi:TetR family transcriptional regulator [Herbihabitans rhizosphaerae]|uniref:TetR family transcriptional regulator n=1 Tax=Herbihabitans rhizosphaerae TaxID=1872711 RepID=A0A4Q7KUS1_9PSEU|nr:TetR/AcrR family transcriptional regulator [Herbihabitans rhizosphaerae]RZS40748.1 TetR family transcriptional regulator [Herbihabitans rhizosphaerae]